MNNLIVLLGPTGVGKTELSLRVAERFGSPILSSDSRQLFRELPVGTAAPTPEQMRRVKHYFVGTLSIHDYYSASHFEEEAIALIHELHRSIPTVVMTGGSMMYIDAVCKGIDDIPTVLRSTISLRSFLRSVRPPGAIMRRRGWIICWRS